MQPSDQGESIANLGWFDTFGDPVLRAHIEAALAENRDLAVAAARITEARELVTVVRADQFPSLDLFGGARRGRQSQILVPGAPTSDDFSISGDLSFEVDLWRKLSRASEAARADLLATEAAHRNATIRLVSDVASTYLLLRDVDARLELAERTARGRTDSLKIIQARFEKSSLNSSEAKAWNLTAGLFAPVFHAGQLRAQAKAQHARAEQALRGYEAALRQAFREVEDALVAVRSVRAEHDARGRQVGAARNAARLSRARDDGGVVDYLEVLEPERSLFSAELDESATRQAALTALVGLYQALGGGWTPTPPVSP